MKTTTPTVGTTQAEADVLAATAAAIAAGQDPFGDGDDEQPESTTTAAAAEEEGTTTTAAGEDANGEKSGEEEVAGDEEDTDLTPEQLAAIAGEETPEPAPAPRYKTVDPADLQAQRAEQIGIKAKALKDLMDGVIEPEEYSRIETEVADKLEELAVQRTLHEANVQTEQLTQEAELDKIIAAAKKAGEVDYRADPKAAKQFDTAMAMLAQDGEKRTYAKLVEEAHQAVLAIRGIKPAAAPAPAATPAQPRENGKGPMTLRNVPAAETPNSGGGWKEQLAALSGQAYEEAFAKLSPGQRAELLND
jgi:hypothetical protein